VPAWPSPRQTRYSDPISCTARDGRLLFTENETNNARLFGTANPTPYVKDGINDYLVAGRPGAVNPDNTGTKAAAYYELSIAARATAVIRLRLNKLAPGAEEPFGERFEDIASMRRREADAFYRAITPPGIGDDAANVMRQALAGMLWSKQHSFYDVDKWLEEHRADPLLSETGQARNREWFHMVSDHVISMPDKWEYPGLRPRISPFTRSRCRPSTSILPRRSSICCLSGPISTRTARSPPMSGTSATSIRRCTAGLRSFSTGWSRRYAERPISTS
jgi:hypothetical protein